MKKNNILKCFFDGAYSISTNTMGYGVVIRHLQPDLETLVEEGGKIDKAKGSVNYAEYFAFLKIIEYLCSSEYEDCEIYIYGDSRMVVNQMNRKFKIRNGVYVPLAYIALELVDKLRADNDVIIQWIPRDENGVADNLAKTGKNGR